MATVLMRRRWRWICHSLHHQDRPTMDARGKAKKGSPEDHVAADGREGNEADELITFTTYSSMSLFKQKLLCYRSLISLVFLLLLL